MSTLQKHSISHGSSGHLTSTSNLIIHKSIKSQNCEWSSARTTSVDQMKNDQRTSTISNVCTSKTAYGHGSVKTLAYIYIIEHKCTMIINHNDDLTQ